jgi:hypothetical protein
MIKTLIDSNFQLRNGGLESQKKSYGNKLTYTATHLPINSFSSPQNEFFPLPLSLSLSHTSLLRIRQKAIQKRLTSSSFSSSKTNIEGKHQFTAIIKKNGFVELFQFVSAAFVVGGALWVFENQIKITEMRGEDPEVKVGSQEYKILQGIDKACKPWHPETPVAWIPRQKYEEIIWDAVLDPPAGLFDFVGNNRFGKVNDPQTLS